MERNRRFSSTEKGYPMPRDFVGGNPNFSVVRIIDSHSNEYNDGNTEHFPNANGGANDTDGRGFYSTTDYADDYTQFNNDAAAAYDEESSDA